MNSELIDYRQGIYAFDAGYLRPQLAAVHLIESAGRVAFVDTGTYKTLPRALAALDALGLTPDAVDYIILTHIHLDHAGGAGAMINALPHARLVVHPRGAPHMVKPDKLMAGVAAVYGKERAQQLYGELQPVAAERIIEAHDNTVLDLGRRKLLCIDSPGHARHHIAIRDSRTKGIFTGDTLGISYREMQVDGRPFLFPTTTPSQFDPVAMHASVARMMALEPTAAYLTHFGQLADPRKHAATLLRRVDASVQIAEDAAKVGAGDAAIIDTIRNELARFLLSEAHAHGSPLSDGELLACWAIDLDLNAQGLAIWATATH